MSQIYIPDNMTKACRQFLMDDVVLSTFAAIVPPLPDFVKGAIDVMNSVLRVEDLPDLAKQILEVATQKVDQSVIAEGKIHTYFQYSQPLLFQMILSRGMDSFISYLSDILASIFRKNPDLLLKQDKPSTNSKRKSKMTVEEMADLSERIVNQKSRKSLRNLANYFEKDVGFILFNADDVFNRAYYINEVRNIIVHNRGKVDTKFIEHNQGTSLKLNDVIPLTLEGVLADLQFIKECVLGIDSRVILQFNLPT